MKFFYLSSNPNDNGIHEVHDRECDRIPSSYDRDYLGPYNSGKEAIRKAKAIKENVGLCETCCDTSSTSLISNMND